MESTSGGHVEQIRVYFSKAKQVNSYICPYCFISLIFIICLMQFREQIEFTVVLKMFEAIKFWFKGEYFLRISIFEQAKNKEILQWAYPKIIYLQSQAHRKLKDQPKNIIYEGQGYYESKIFDIFFENETHIINDCCAFKIECPTIKKGKDTSETKMKVQLYKNKKKEVVDKRSPCKSNRSSSRKVSKENKPGSYKKEDQKLIKVTEKTLTLKRHSERQLDEYQCCFFQQNEYFSMVYFYVGSVSLGWKLRKYPMQICQYISLQTTQRQKLHFNNMSQAKSYQQACSLIKRFKGQLSLKEYYEKTIIFGFKAYNQIRRRLKLMGVQIGTYPQIQINFLKQDINDIDFQYFIEEKYEAGLEEYHFQILKESFVIAQYTKLLLSRLYLTLINTHANYFKQKCDISFNNFVKTVYDLSILKANNTERLNHRDAFLVNKNNLKQETYIVDEKLFHIPLVYQFVDPSGPIKSSPAKYKAKNMVIFVHGYLGNQYDFEKASNYLYQADEKLEIVIIKEMETKKEDLESIGIFLASEVKKQINQCSSIINRISFIGYSLGGLIIRVALKHLEEYKHKLNLLITFSSPHLGTSLCQNNLVKIGLCFMAKVQRVKSMQQINHHQQYMEELSNHDGISWFKKIVLIGSPEDQFIPYASATLTPELIQDEKAQKNCRNLIKLARQIQRLQIWFNADDLANPLQKIIGKKSHIEFIDNDLFLKIVFHLYSSQF